MGGGLYVLDIYLPPQYPSVPPKAFYWAYGKYINPNLYECGKVCLSLLGTWSGPGWDPQRSTLLQFLVSVQGMILIENPYCNEPGQERDGGTRASVNYNKAVMAGVMDNMAKMLSSPPAGLKHVVEGFMFREGKALLRRALFIPNDQLTDAHIEAVDAALRHPFGERVCRPALGDVEAGRMTYGGEVPAVPKWLTVAEKPFTSGYAR